MLVGGAGPWPSWLWGRTLCGAFGPTGGQGSLPTWLAAQPRLGTGLLLTHWRSGQVSAQLSVQPRGVWSWCGPIGGWGWVPDTNRLKGILFQNGAYQHLCYHGRMNFPKWLLPASQFLGGVPSCLLLLQEALQDQQMGLTQASFKLLPLHWDSEHVRFCVCPLRVESLLPITLWLFQTWTLLVFKAGHSFGSSSQCSTPGLGSPVWSLDRSFLGEYLGYCNIPPICGSSPQGCGFWPDCISSSPTCLVIPSLYL